MCNNHGWLVLIPALQSDTPYRRSFTVLDNIGQGRQGRASVAMGERKNTNAVHWRTSETVDSPQSNVRLKVLQSCNDMNDFFIWDNKSKPRAAGCSEAPELIKHFIMHSCF